MNPLNLIYTALGWVLRQIYALLGYISPLFQNYALAILLFTILINLILLPINFNQQKTMAKQTALRPKLDLLKKKCNGDNQKYNQEMQALYQRENVKMMGGCLPMLIRLPFLWGVWRAISNPLSHIIVVGSDVVEQAKEYLINNVADFAGRQLAQVTELDVLHYLDELQTAMPDLYNKAAGYVNFDLFGIDLTQMPKFTLNFSSLQPGQLALWLIPLLSFATAMLSSVMSMRMQKKTNPDAASMGGLMLTMPLVSLVIAFTVPAAVGFYWACSNVVIAVIQYLLNKYYSPYTIIAKNEIAVVEALRKKEKESQQKPDAQTA